MLANVRYFAENNVKGVYSEANYYSPTCDFDELRAYIQSKILWDPYMSEEEYWGHIDDFLTGYYGEGGTYIRQYIDLAQELVKDTCFSIKDGSSKIYPTVIVEDKDAALPTDLTVAQILDYQNTDWSPYIDWYRKIDSELVNQGEVLFEQALAVATEEQVYRLNKAKLQLDVLNSYYCYKEEKYTNKSKIVYNLTKVIRGILESRRDEHTLSDDEIISLTKEITTYVAPLCAQFYADSNQALYEALRSYGITHVWERSAALTKDASELDFNKQPREWAT